jgi:hypothetical protein
VFITPARFPDFAPVSNIQMVRNGRINAPLGPLTFEDYWRRYTRGYSSLRFIYTAPYVMAAPSTSYPECTGSTVGGIPVCGYIGVSSVSAELANAAISSGRFSFANRSIVAYIADIDDPNASGINLGEAILVEPETFTIPAATRPYTPPNIFVSGLSLLHELGHNNGYWHSAIWFCNVSAGAGANLSLLSQANADLGPPSWAVLASGYGPQTVVCPKQEYTAGTVMGSNPAGWTSSGLAVDYYTHKQLPDTAVSVITPDQFPQTRTIWSGDIENSADIQLALVRGLTGVAANFDLFFAWQGPNEMIGDLYYFVGGIAGFTPSTRRNIAFPNSVIEFPTVSVRGLHFGRFAFSAPRYRAPFVGERVRPLGVDLVVSLDAIAADQCSATYTFQTVAQWCAVHPVDPPICP